MTVFLLLWGFLRTSGSYSLTCKDEDTMVAHSDVFKYIGCNEGTREVLDCPSGSFFDVRSACCIGGNEIKIDEFCNSRQDGTYGNPWNCTTFITCANEREYLLPCPQKTIYNPVTKQCMWWVKNSCKQIECTEENDEEVSV
eukprot:Seg536.1 transcript_id=Seg536.1/GoldUCD/mRNA.D3Y31 product="hypothetical protein" protein_id=Seg536.1/GoldUCD/D3Y31